MAAGDKLIISKRNSAMTSIDNARAKWGLTKINNTVSTGSKVNASDYNNLVNWLTEAKNKAGASTAIESTVSVGDIIKESKILNLQTQANSVYNYCTCHGNCTGSCTGGCTGSCTGSCSGGCRSCSGSCQGLCDSCRGH